MLPRSLALLALAALLVLAACSPPTAPLYRDYGRAPAATDSVLLERLAAAFREAGWEIVETDLPGVVATDEKTMRHWGIYRVRVSLEATPLGERHVRVFVHPFRRFLTGGQSKLFGLDSGLRNAIFPDLDTAFAAHGFERARAE